MRFTVNGVYATAEQQDQALGQWWCKIDKLSGQVEPEAFTQVAPVALVSKNTTNKITEILYILFFLTI